MAFGRQPLKNEFSWSKSRHEKLAECPRQYFFHYYGSWGGWERGAAPDVKELYTLKKLTARPAWAGSTVHDTIKRALTLVRDGQPLDGAQLIDRTRARVRAEFRESRLQTVAQIGEPNDLPARVGHLGFIEHPSCGVLHLGKDGR